MAPVSTNIKIDPELKEQAESLVSEMLQKTPKHRYAGDLL